MYSDLYKKDFLKLLDLSTEDIVFLIDLSSRFKKLKNLGIDHRFLVGKNIVLLFEKTSTRTRCSFEVAAYDLGMGVTYLDPASSQMGNKESISDTARVLSRFYDGIEYRGFAQSIVEELAESSSVPVWNGLTDEFHPTQMIADMLTVRESFPNGFKGLKLVFFGDARNNVANSLMVVCSKLGIDFTACGPSDLMPDPELVGKCKDIAEGTGSVIILTDDIDAASSDANIIYTDIWVSMGEDESLWKSRIEDLRDFKVTRDVLDNAADDVIFMHCLPSFHDTSTEIGKKIFQEYGLEDMEVTDEVFDSDRSMVFEEAENRMHSIKAIIYATLSPTDRTVELLDEHVDE